MTPEPMRVGGNVVIMFPVLAVSAALGPPDGPNANIAKPRNFVNLLWIGNCLGGMSMIARSDKLEFPGDLKCKSILFVCWGNICRSPAAASILKREMKRMGIAGLHVESAGVCPEDQPQNPSLRMRWASFRRGVWLKSKQRLLTRNDLARFDLIIAMDRDVLYSIHAIARGKTANVKLLSEFLSGDWPIDVPDPMRRSVSTCNRVLDMLHRACQEMVNTLGLPR